MKIMVAIPVLNEEAQLEQSICALVGFLQQHRGFDCEILIADNGSTDRTLEVAHDLERRFATVKASHLPLRGRGRALKTAWSHSPADILSYMDVDLSTDLSAFPALIQPLASRRFDLATGSRLLADALTVRCWQREVISRVYNRLVKMVFGTQFSDAQCGFKAITRGAAQALLPLVQDTGWFFDTELLVIAEKRGYRILDLPVKWTEHCDSRVKIFRTILAQLAGTLRLWRTLPRVQQAQVQPPQQIHPASTTPP